jgi:hypothetical protein
MKSASHWFLFTEELSGIANQADELRHARYVLREITFLQLQLKPAKGREHLEGPGIIGIIIL